MRDADTHEQRLPLTPEMTTYLQSQSSAANHPFRLYLIFVGGAAALPLIITIILLMQGRLLQWATLFLWILFPGAGAALARYVLGIARREQRDVAGGEFVRASGEFRVAVSSGRAGTKTEVTIAGTTAWGGFPQALESIRSAPALGTVDFAPVSRALLEVRDGSGQILWSALHPVAAHRAAR